MANPNGTRRELIEGRPALVVIDIQASTFVHQDVRAIDHMPGYAERMAKARRRSRSTQPGGGASR